MAVAVVPVIFVVLGLLLWVLAHNPKVAEAGKLVFFAGVLALAFSLSKTTMSIGLGEPRDRMDLEGPLVLHFLHDGLDVEPQRPDYVGCHLASRRPAELAR